MYKLSRYHIVVIIALLLGLFYISRTLLGVITQFKYIEQKYWIIHNILDNSSILEEYNSDILGEPVENNLPKDFTRNVSTNKYLPSCSETQDKAQLRIQNYCKDRSKIWTEVKLLVVYLVSFNVKNIKYYK